MPSTRDQRPYNVAYYASHREQEIERVTRRQQATLDWLRDLRRVPCMDCGGVFPPWVMDFDHRDPTEKSFAIAGDNVMLKNRAVLEAEVAKCDVICANCHRIRTDAQYENGVIVNCGFGIPDVLKPGSDAAKRRRQYHERREQQMDVLKRIRGLPCFDCGDVFPLCVMEFDHRDPMRKSGLVSYMAGRVKIATLLEEIAKCDIVCANCHRMRTFARRAVAAALRGCGLVVRPDPSKVETRVRFPPPAPAIGEQLRWIKEPLRTYDAAAA